MNKLDMLTLRVGILEDTLAITKGEENLRTIQGRLDELRCQLGCTLAAGRQPWTAITDAEHQRRSHDRTLHLSV